MRKPSYKQLKLLVEFLLENPAIAKLNQIPGYNLQQKRQKWSDFAVKANTLGSFQKDAKGWAKYWSAKRSRLKKRCRQYVQTLRRVESGDLGELLSGFKYIDHSLVTAMGGVNLAAGEFSLDPLPGTSQWIEEGAPESDQEFDLRRRSHGSANETMHPSSPASPPEPSPVLPNSPTDTRRHRSRRAARNNIFRNRQRAQIRLRSVEAAEQIARDLARAVDQIVSLVGAVDRLSTSLTVGNRAVADALNNIAAALARQ